jgi:GGDEF domain-containing protein
MVVKGVQSVNARYGFGVGDRMLRAFKEHIEKRLPRTDKLFRWEGPAVVVLLDRKDPLEQVRAEVRRMLDTQIEEALQLDGRSVMIPISAAWLVSVLMPPLAIVVRSIQSFIASQGSHDAST